MLTSTASVVSRIRGLAATVGLTLLVAGLTACTTGVGSPPTPTPSVSAVTEPSVPSEAVDCAAGRDPVSVRAPGLVAIRDGQVVDRSTLSRYDSPGPTGLIDRQPLPPDFTVTGAVVCLEIWDTDTGFVGYSQRLYSGDLSELVGVLTTPDAPRSDMVCGDIYDPHPNLWLLGSDGTAIAPRWPADECGLLRNPTPETYLNTATLGEPTATPDR